EMEEEGPYGEIYGFMGLKKPRNFFMNVTAVTHRRDPWFVNCFAGVTKLVHTMPTHASDYLKLKRMIPSLTDFYAPSQMVGVAIASLDKTRAGEGMVAGQLIAATRFLSKVIVVVDSDVDILDPTLVLQAVGARWQPYPASLLIHQTSGMPLDPSAPKRGLTSKIVIDATKQLPDEGGPAEWPPISSLVLKEMCPEAFDLVEEKWAGYGV
ncbi:MAG TPA: UbiD family decarboxylase domain-containing protein, partial [Hyphomicrobium sp.]